MITKNQRQTDIPASTSGHRLITGMASEYAARLTGYSPEEGTPPPSDYSDAFAAYVIGGEQVLHTVTNTIRFLGHTGGIGRDTATRLLCAVEDVFQTTHKPR